uniref:Uncharacterized protein n=1 Tax=Arundo donax TaxID=35708 RepID=A0A0A9BMZ3_ARUDO
MLRRGGGRISDQRR